MKFSTWQELIDHESNLEYWQELDRFVTSRRSQVDVYPDRSEVLRCFDLLDMADVKVVVLGQDPYHQPGQANGLAFSVNSDCKAPPSLRNIFAELNSDMGIDRHSNDLVNWAKQGVLLLNTTLTVERDTPGAHQGKGWETFTDRVISELGSEMSSKVFVLWGAAARQKRSLIGQAHSVIESAHPSPLSAYRGFWGSRPFSRINDKLTALGHDQIDWSL